MSNSNSLAYRFITISLAWLLASYATVRVLPRALMIRITQEDSFFENLTFLAFFAAAGMFLHLYLTRPQPNNFLFFRTRRNLFFLLLAGLFFFCGAEEISWGQRVFNTEASGVFQDNLQHETNLHNQAAFVYEYYDKDGRVARNPGLLRKVFRQENLINLFCYSWCVLVPLSARFSGWARRFWAALNVPLVPLWLGALLVLDSMLLHVGRWLLPGNSEVTGIKTVEIKECGMALLFFSIGLWFLLRTRPARPQEPGEANMAAEQGSSVAVTAR